MKKRDRIAIIPARGGSKRIPRKNVIDFDGRPMIAWTIDAALGAGIFDRVLVSTDDADIAAISRAAGAEVPFLRSSAADDSSHASAATRLALGQAMQYWDETYEIVAQLMPNCPLRDAGHVKDAMDLFIRRGADFQISCFQYGWMNPWWAVTLGADGRPAPCFPQAMNARSQDLPTLYCPTGAIWIARAVAFLDAGTFYGPEHRFAPLPWTAAVDVDDTDDLVMARAIRRMELTGA